MCLICRHKTFKWYIGIQIHVACCFCASLFPKRIEKKRLFGQHARRVSQWHLPRRLPWEQTCHTEWSHLHSPSVFCYCTLVCAREYVDKKKKAYQNFLYLCRFISIRTLHEQILSFFTRRLLYFMPLQKFIKSINQSDNQSIAQPHAINLAATLIHVSHLLILYTDKQ